MTRAGLIVAGGRGRRMGMEKALVAFGAGTLLDAVIARAAPQVPHLGLNLPAGPAYETRYGHYPLIRDPYGTDKGPLGGVIAGLAWLENFSDVETLATFPGDTPFLPETLVAQLSDGRHGTRPAVAQDMSRIHHLCALWPRHCLPALRQGVESGSLVSVRQALQALDAVSVSIEAPSFAFFNVNTAEDLTRAEALAAALETEGVAR